MIKFEIQANHGPVEAQNVPPIYSLQLSFLMVHVWFPVASADIFASLRRAMERTDPESLSLIPLPDDVEPKTGESSGWLCALLDAVAVGDAQPFIDEATREHKKRADDENKRYQDKIKEIHETFERLNRAQ